MSIEVRRMLPSDAEAVFRLRRQALAEEPFAFLASPEDDKASSAAAFREQLSSSPDEFAVFGALDGEALVGMVGLARDRPIKASHRACIWGVFVRASHRRRGVGERLFEATLGHARGVEGLGLVYLSVSERTPAAKRLYERVGFVEWGLEPDCIRYGGESAAEHHLSLAL